MCVARKFAFIFVVSCAGLIISVLRAQASCKSDANCEYPGCNDVLCSEFHEEFPGITGGLSEFCRNGVWRVHCESTNGQCNYHTPLHEFDDLGHYHWKYQHNIDNRKHNPVENNHAANLERDHVNLDYNYERTDDMQPSNFEELRVDPAHNTSEITRKSTEEHEFHRRFLIHKCWPRSVQYRLAS
mmetsp:Transcript_46623/g.75071  ORF Transcript_46623/g.75071 Transcript_46623/m.75071 type:complete len:185 (+) Transcript_46623:136-690(+)